MVVTLVMVAAVVVVRVSSKGSNKVVLEVVVCCM